MYARHFAKVPRGHQPTFTHSDIQKKNIFVRKVETNGFHNFEITLIDWEYAGWYPEYWEYFSVFSEFKWEYHWVRLIDCAIDSWPAETATMDMMSHDFLW